MAKDHSRCLDRSSVAEQPQLPIISDLVDANMDFNHGDDFVLTRLSPHSPVQGDVLNSRLSPNKKRVGRS
jgi:hypothetical protein